MNTYSISMINTRFITHFKVKHRSILIGYYKSHVVGNRNSIRVAIIKLY